VTEQAEHLERVTARIGDAVIAFLNATLWHDGSGNATFYASELRDSVARKVRGGAPGSADRVLRSLRQAGRVGYEVVSRRESLYRVLWVK
jgi:hypothetical protein